MAKRKNKNKRQVLIRKAKAATILRKRVAKNDFWAFCLYYDPKFFSKRLFLKKVAEAFMRVYSSYMAGIIYRLAVSMPPRAGKSYISSLFIAWMYGHFPEESVMRNCCSDTLYNKLSYDTRDIVKSKRFREIFSEIHLKGDKQNVKSWNIEGARQVSYFGGGVGGTSCHQGGLPPVAFRGRHYGHAGRRAHRLHLQEGEIGRASCRERV